MVYQLTCRINGKRYVGVTKHFRIRWGEHKKANSVVGKAIRKHGAHNFRIAVLSSRLPKKTALDLEVCLISQKQTLVPQGYNVTKGGQGGGYWKGKKFTKEHREKISKNTGARHPDVRKRRSESMMGKNNPMYGKKHSAETLEKISKNNAAKRPEVRAKISKSRTGKPGHKHTMEHRRWLSENNPGKRPDVIAKIKETKRHNKENKNQLNLFDYKEAT